MSFYPRKPQHVVTTAEDRTFKVSACVDMWCALPWLVVCMCTHTQIWNLRESALVYQSAIISGMVGAHVPVYKNMHIHTVHTYVQ